VTPKRCAQLPGNRTVIGHSEAVSRIESAVYARSDPDPLIIIGRTDSAASLGINEAIRRAKDFISVGAEAVFVELKAGQNILRDVARIAEEVRAPCMVNMSVDSRLMALPPIDWRAHGIAIGIFPALARGTFGFALQENMKRLISGNVVELVDNLMPLGVYSEVLGLSSVESWEKRFSSDSKA
jgi:2-methylisocitrate lyase-like PEP mutase family enzyme